MHRSWLAFIESNTTGTGRSFAGMAAVQGFQPVLLAKDPARYSYSSEDWLRVIRVDTHDSEAVLKVCQYLTNDRGLAGVTSSSEYFIEMAGEIARQLVLPGPNPEAVHACRDKLAQRIRLRDAGVGIPKFISADSPGAASEAAEALGLPVVLKPPCGSGSVGVKMCESLGEVRAHTSVLLRQKANERGLPMPGRILVEEMVSGPEYSVEAFGQTIVGITHKHLGPLPHFVEIGHDFPAVLPHETESAIRDATMSALNALGLGWGPSHCELRLTEQGVKIIEVNPRLAGGHIPELVRLGFGIDMIAETIRLVVGRRSCLEKTMDLYSSIRFIIPDREGILIKVENPFRAERLSGLVEAKLYASIGDTIRCRGDFRSRIGHVIGIAKSAECSRAIAEEALSMIKLTIEAESRGVPQA